MTHPRMLAAAAVSAALALSLTACGGDSDAATGTSAACPDGTLSFGVEPYEDPKVLVPLYRDLGEALGERLGCEVDVQIVESYVGEILAMKNGKLDIGQFGPLGFVFAQRQAGAVPLVSFADADGEPSTYTGGIWAAADSGIDSVKDLPGRTIALSEAGSTSGDALPRQAMTEAGVEDDVETLYAGGHPEAMLALTNGKVDAAEINSQTLASARDAGTFDPDDYVQVWESDPIANDPITASPELSPEAREEIEKALLDLEKDDVAAIGEYLDFESPEKPLVPVDVEFYRPLFDLADSLGLTEEDL